MAKNHYRKLKRWKRTSENSRLITQLREIWSKPVVRVVVGLVLVLGVFLSIYLFNKYNSYDSYEVRKSIKVESGTDSKYVAYKDFVIKYSGDGISYISEKGVVWEEGYEMKTPIVDVCGAYLAVADKNTNDILIYNEEGLQGNITTGYPIVKFEVAKQGVVAAMLEDQGINYIEVYDKEGNQLVSHKTLIDENGYPIDFSLSEDGTKMVVSYLTVNQGGMSNKVMFYNFSNAGKNVEDRMVGAFNQYEEVLVPTVQFISNNDAIAVGENVLSIYKMKDKPRLVEEIEIKDEIQKVFYNEKYIGLVFHNENSNAPCRVEVYSLSGSRKMKEYIHMEYDTYKFSGDNVLMYNDLNCQILSLGGVQKFAYTFKGEVNSIIPIDGARTFLFMTNSAIEKVKLK